MNLNDIYKYKKIGLYKEFYGEKYPSMKDFFTEEPVEYKQAILDYLKQGEAIAAAPGICRDVFTGERILMDMLIQGDGKHIWHSELVYYVDKYNLKLPDEFIDHVLKEKS